MKANSAPMPVADYCNDLKSSKIKVNTDYQRSEGLWNSQARSFFIESILLEFPIPKIFLYAKLDLKTRTTVKEIVDGQQRSKALLDFYNNKLKLSIKVETEEFKGKKYTQLDEIWQTRFLAYSLPIDQFAGVTEDIVQEAFRRMNANNVPLNNEEQRNAKFQGPFKWFIISLAKKYRNQLAGINLLSKRDIIRMVDIKLYAEVIFVLDEGFKTIKDPQLNKLYRKYNGEFNKEYLYYEIMCFGLDEFLTNDNLHRKPFLRGHIFQSIILAIIGQRYEYPYIDQAFTHMGELTSQLNDYPVTLELLAHALEEPELYEGKVIEQFISACTTGTNVAEARMIRFMYFYNALNI